MTHTILKGKGKRKRKGKGQGRDKEGKGREMDKLSGDSRRKTHIIPPAWAKPFRAWPPVYLMIFTAVAPACEFDQPGAVAFTPWQDRHWGRPARAAGATAYTHISVYVQYSTQQPDARRHVCTDSHGNNSLISGKMPHCYSQARTTL